MDGWGLAIASGDQGRPLLKLGVVAAVEEHWPSRCARSSLHGWQRRQRLPINTDGAGKPRSATLERTKVPQRCAPWIMRTKNRLSVYARANGSASTRFGWDLRHRSRDPLSRSEWLEICIRLVDAFRHGLADRSFHCTRSPAFHSSATTSVGISTAASPSHTLENLSSRESICSLPHGISVSQILNSSGSQSQHCDPVDRNGHHHPLL